VTSYNVDTADADASKTVPVKASSLRINGHVMLNKRACKIVGMTTNGTGKHGHAMVHVTGLELGTNRKLEHIFKSTHNADVPVTKKTEYIVCCTSFVVYQNAFMISTNCMIFVLTHFMSICYRHFYFFFLHVY